MYEYHQGKPDWRWVPCMTENVLSSIMLLFKSWPVTKIYLDSILFAYVFNLFFFLKGKYKRSRDSLSYWWLLLKPLLLTLVTTCSGHFPSLITLVVKSVFHIPLKHRHKQIPVIIKQGTFALKAFASSWLFLHCSLYVSSSWTFILWTFKQNSRLLLKQLLDNYKSVLTWCSNMYMYNTV